MGGWRKFDPWPIFFKREWNRNWPFLVGFAVTGTIITKISLGLTGTNFLIFSLFHFFRFLFCHWLVIILVLFHDFFCVFVLFAEEQAKNSKFVQRHKGYSIHLYLLSNPRSIIFASFMSFCFVCFCLIRIRLHCDDVFFVMWD